MSAFDNAFPRNFGGLVIERSIDGTEIALWAGSRLIWRGPLTDWLWAISHPADAFEGALGSS